MASFSEGKVIEYRQSVVYGLIAARDCTICGNVVDVHARIVPVVVLQGVGRVVDGLGLGEGIDEVQA